ncbi:sensor histidine kinase [Insolitispirillum peregrinum]|uniref:histidine kinase n=1 Tax=Insolitispirillum peregrinum TaxID=80876 RepID=A0A1N7L5K6_9PROT|nr:HAMP domain-containing sensor histidine kinase [Insolitispirillum peregrinum]SIS69097.1 His Kinase A (phospho-acceptor) domain-containing protein [Insolitispirillum peregrinum]
MRRDIIRRFQAASAVIGLVAFTAAVGLASWAALDHAAYLLQRASYSQRQLELFGHLASRLNRAVADHIRALALEHPSNVADWQRDLEQQLDALTAVTSAEVALVADNRDEENSERDELAEIARWREDIRALALAASSSPASSPQAALQEFEQQARHPYADSLATRLQQAADDEHGEIDEVHRQMDTTRHHLVLLGIGGVLAHTVAATAVARLVIRRREHLEAEVARRTASLQQANDELQRVDDCRKRFFADVSHELRTPLTTIQGEAEVMLTIGGVEDSGYRAALAAIQANAGSLHRRIDDLLAVARSGDGQIALECQPLDLCSLTSTALSDVNGLARANDVRLTSTLPPRPVWVMGDASWLKQALLTLIDNAVKFSRPGQDVILSVVPQGERVSVAITDHGEGIAQADLPRLFDRFFQAPAGRQRGGSGLGLAVARWIVEQHGGSIAITSAPQAGTTVTFFLPVPAPEAIA